MTWKAWWRRFWRSSAHQRLDIELICAYTAINFNDASRSSPCRCLHLISPRASLTPRRDRPRCVAYANATWRLPWCLNSRMRHRNAFRCLAKPRLPLLTPAIDASLSTKIAHTERSESRGGTSHRAIPPRPERRGFSRKRMTTNQNPQKQPELIAAAKTRLAVNRAVDEFWRSLEASFPGDLSRAQWIDQMEGKDFFAVHIWALGEDLSQDLYGVPGEETEDGCIEHAWIESIHAFPLDNDFDKDRVRMATSAAIDAVRSTLSPFFPDMATNPPDESMDIFGACARAALLHSKMEVTQSVLHHPSNP